MMIEKLIDMAKCLFSPAQESCQVRQFWGETELPPLPGLFDRANEPAKDINDHVEAHLRRAYEMAMDMEKHRER